MNIQLEPCPFCGGEAKIYMRHYKIGLKLWCECKICHAKTVGYLPEDDLDSFEQCKESSIKAWNRRVYQLNNINYNIKE